MGRPVIVTLLPLLIIIGLTWTQSEPTAAPIPEPEPTSTAIPVPTATPPPPLVLESMRWLKDGYGWAHMSGAVRNVSKKALRVRPRGSWHTAKETIISEAILHESNTVELGYQGLPPGTDNEGYSNANARRTTGHHLFCGDTGLPGLGASTFGGRTGTHADRDERYDGGQKLDDRC